MRTKSVLLSLCLVLVTAPSLSLMGCGEDEEVLDYQNVENEDENANGNTNKETDDEPNDGNEQGENNGNNGTSDEGDAYENTAYTDDRDVFDIRHSPIRGNENAIVTVVEFADFQCPHCKNAEPELLQVLNTSGDQVRLVYKNFPLSSFHEYAEDAARSARAALLQGKFWEYHDIIFERQEALNTDNLSAWAVELDLDMDDFEADRASEDTAVSVAKDIALGQSVGVTGTPTIFVNGRRLMEAATAAHISELVQQEISAMNALLADGKSLSEALTERMNLHQP